LEDEYFLSVQNHLKELRFRDGLLLSAELGPGNEGVHYVLRRTADRELGWRQRILDWIRSFLARRPSAFSFRIAERDEAGARALSELRDTGLNGVANALAQSVDHILNYFVMLRTELAFYIGCVHLHHELSRRNVSVCFPTSEPAGTGRQAFSDLRDVSLALAVDRDVVGNDVDADGKKLVVVTGANQGGKSTFLRSVGQAQLMMQAGMFVAARAFRADLCNRVFTHFRREEDATMKRGRFAEELGRMSDIVDALVPNSMLLLNESLAATNEREGSEVARQIVNALLEAKVKVFFVTHLYEFADGLWADRLDSVLFLRAERTPDGQRTFKLAPGQPLQTSFGVDVYREVFGER